MRQINGPRHNGSSFSCSWFRRRASRAPNYSHVWVSNNCEYSGKMFPYRNGLGDTEVKRSHRMLKMVVLKKMLRKLYKPVGLELRLLFCLFKGSHNHPKVNFSHLRFLLISIMDIITDIIWLRCPYPQQRVRRTSQWTLFDPNAILV